MPAYSLNVRVFWPLATCGCTALLGLLQALRTRAGPAVATLLLALLLAYGALRRRRRRRRRPPATPEGEPRPASSPPPPPPPPRAALDAFYARRLRASPHVLGHSKAHVRLVLGELGRAGRAGGRLGLRGDAVPVGSAYEQHRARSRQGAFDVLLPLRLEPRRALRVEPRPPGRHGAFACALRVPAAGALSPEEEEDEAGGGRRLSAALVLRWFQGHLARCLGAVRCQLQGRVHVSLAAGPGRPLALLLVPPADDVCGHLSLTVRLIPAIPFGESLYLTPMPATHATSGKLAAFWTLDVSKVEQRLLAWLKERSPTDSCHLKCLQILKGLRDLRARSLEQPLASQWGRVLSSYALKTALFSLLLRGPLQAWADRFLVERLEDLVLFLEDALHKRLLQHVFLGSTSLPEAISVPKFLKEVAPVNLLDDFDSSTLDRVAAQLLDMWRQAPQIVWTYCGPWDRRTHPV